MFSIPFNHNKNKAQRQSYYVSDFDDRLTRVSFGHASVDEYYRSASSAQHVAGVRVPTLFLSALDDPIVAPGLIPRAQVAANPWCVLATTRLGGHIGWFEGLDGTQWHTRGVVEFVRAITATAPPRSPAPSPVLRGAHMGGGKGDGAAVVSAAPGPGSTLAVRREVLSSPLWILRLLSRGAKLLALCLLLGLLQRRWRRW